MTIPTRRAMWLLGLGAAVCLAAAADLRLVPVAIAIDLVTVAGVLLEGKWLGNGGLVVRRQWPRQLQADRIGRMRLVIENPSSRRVEVAIRQIWPVAFDAQPVRLRAKLGPHEAVGYDLEVTPRRRGPTQVPPTEVDVARVGGLAARRVTIDQPKSVVVFPNLKGVAAYDQLRRSRALWTAGLHRQRLLGIGREFDQMREYQTGDDFRNVNWKATARLGRPMTNLYQAERSRDVMICLDGGRMMGNPIAGGDRTALDVAVEAAILLVHACRDQGDRVGMITFRERVDKVIAATSAATTNGVILQTLAEFDARPVFPSFVALVETLRLRQTHRSLVFILTDLSDPQLAGDLAEVMPLLATQHMVVVVALEDPFIEQIADGPATDREGVACVLAARRLATERDEHRRQLIRAGVQVLQAGAERMSIALINKYLEVKARQLV